MNFCNSCRKASRCTDETKTSNKNGKLCVEGTGWFYCPNTNKDIWELEKKIEDLKIKLKAATDGIKT